MNSGATALYDLLKSHFHTFHKIVDIGPSDKLIHFDFSDTNNELQQLDLTDTENFSTYITSKLNNAKAKFGIGGYNENRSFYKRSNLFSIEKSGVSTTKNQRTLHLGIDVWGEEGTKIYAPLEGRVHSFAFNNYFGDYGSTIILSHQLDGVSFYTLYGHLSLRDITAVKKGSYINRGEQFAHFGNTEENGNWPPHLHFQIINDIGNYEGDYPGVCSFSERKKYLDNSPDPDIILCLNKYL